MMIVDLVWSYDPTGCEGINFRPLVDIAREVTKAVGALVALVLMML